MIVTDQLNNSFHLNHPPKRIISLVPSQTELLWDLGLNDEIIGITKFCIHPDELFKSKTKIGGTKTLNIKLINELKPDLIIGNKEENEQQQINELIKHHNVWMSDIFNLDNSLQMIHELGIITQKEIKANEIINLIKDSFQKINQLNKSVLYLIWNKPYMAAGQNTFINDMLKRCGLINVLKQPESRYPELSIDEMIELNPELIFLSSEPYPFKEQHIIELKEKLPHTKMILVDGELFSWYGSRLLKSASYFNQLSTLIS